MYCWGSVTSRKRNCRKRNPSSRRRLRPTLPPRSLIICWRESIANCTRRKRAPTNWRSTTSFPNWKKRRHRPALPRTEMKLVNRRMRNSIVNLDQMMALLSHRVSLLRSVLFFMAVSVANLAGQTPPSPPEKSSAIEAHFSAAQQAQRDKDYPTAEREYQAVLALAPKFAEVHMNLGLVYQLEDRSEDAMTEFRRALKIKPTLAGANFFLGVNHCRNGDGAKAIPYLKIASRQEPNRPDIWAWLATAQEVSGDNQAEVATLKHALRLQPRDVDLLYLLGHAYERLAKQEVVKLEKASPKSSWSEQLLAESYSSSTEWSLAVIRFQNALAASPNRAGLHVRLGEVFLRAGRVDQAAQEFEQELRINPNHLRAMVRRGEVKLIQGDTDAALEDWTGALTMDKPRTERVLGIHETGLGDAVREQP